MRNGLRRSSGGPAVPNRGLDSSTGGSSSSCGAGAVEALVWSAVTGYLRGRTSVGVRPDLRGRRNRHLSGRGDLAGGRRGLGLVRRLVGRLVHRNRRGPGGRGGRGNGSRSGGSRGGGSRGSG